MLKLVAYFLTGSPAMLAEIYHSIATTGNRVSSLVGIHYGDREAGRERSFGYGTTRFYYSLIAAVLLFAVAGVESAQRGYSALVGGETAAADGVASFLGVTFPGVWFNYAVLIGAMVFEAYALFRAYRRTETEANTRGRSSLAETTRETGEVTAHIAVVEHAVAVAGAGIALVGIYLTRVTGNYVYDAASAFVIGLLLVGFAAVLVRENERFVLGEDPSADR
jgi:divalent metal cation (Fe/Co/Zn/Cd) transporter